MRSNRRELVKEVLPNKNREVLSTLFLFSGHITIASYVPEMRKAVILLSTQHHDQHVSAADEQRKPDIIQYYNSTMGGCDTLDQMVSIYSCRRATARWPMRMFHYMIDAMMINTFVVIHVMRENVGSDEMKDRYGVERCHHRKFLEDIAMSLMVHEIERRRDAFVSTVRISKRLQMSFIAAGFPIPMQTDRHRTRAKQGRCYKCPRELDKKIRTVCEDCGKFICKEDAQQRSTCMLACMHH